MTKLIVNGKTISKSEKDCPLKLVVREGETATVELSVSSEDIEKALVRAYDAKTNKSKYPDFALTRDMRKEIEKLLQAAVKEEQKECENCGHFYIPNLECHRPEGSCKTDKYEFWKPIPKEEKKTVEEDKELIQAGKDGERLAEECLRKAEEQLKKHLKKEEKNSCESCGFDSSNCAQIDTQDCKYWKSKENRPAVDWEGLIRTIKDCSLDLKVSGMLIALIRIVKSIHERDK